MSGSPSQLTVIQIGKVRISAMSQTAAAAKNFPKMTPRIEIGKVPSSSIVPFRCSSVQSFMPTAGTSTISTSGR